MKLLLHSILLTVLISGCNNQSKWDEKVGILAGQLQDGIGGRRGDCEINPRVWTYNQGVILSGLAYLSEITGDKSYINQALQLHWLP